MPKMSTANDILKKIFMKKILSFFFLAILFLFFSPSHISAHELTSDGTIGAVMHIEPEDDPVADQQSTFFFELKDKTGKFSSSHCTCTFSVKQHGKIIFSQPLIQNSQAADENISPVVFTFQDRDVYQVTLEGKPNPESAFQPFALVYDVRVDRTQQGKESASNNKKVIAVFFILLLGNLLFILWKRQKKYS